ncbi:PorV/PorQ family protein [bacterium]|nr:PorV/PorQ family protein [bacterium]
MKKPIIVLTIILFLLIPSISSAKSRGTTAATFFKISPGARSAGMGKAYVAMADDSEALFYNPSGLALLSKDELLFTHLNWLAETKYECLTYAFSPEVFSGKIGIGLIYLHNDQIKYTSNGPSWEEKDGYFKFYDYGLVVSYGRKLSKLISVGSNIKFFQEGTNLKGDLSYKTPLNFIFDTGILFKRNSLCLGLCLQNIGPAAKYKEAKIDLPFKVKFGLCYKKFDDRLRIALDLNKPNDHKVSFNLGLEYVLLKLVSLRAGFFKDEDDDSKNFTLGGGFKFKNYYLDYAYTPHQDLGDVQRISFCLKGSYQELWKEWEAKKEIKERKKVRILLEKKEIKKDKVKDQEKENQEEEGDRWKELEKRYLKKYE